MTRAVRGLLKSAGTSHEKGHRTMFDSAELGELEKLQLLRQSVAALESLTGIPATFTHGARSDLLEAALDELPGGAFGMLQYGGENGVAISLVAVSTEDTPTASLIVSSPPIAATEPVGIERLYDLLESLPPHCRPILDPRERPAPMVVVVGMRTLTALTLDPTTNAGLLEWAVCSLRDAHAALKEWQRGEDTSEWERDCPW